MRLFRNIRRERDGAVTIEFALLGPAMITLMLGVVQVGMAMWTYNSMRSVANDVARYAVINYQSSNKLTNSQIQSFARSRATRAPYGMLDSNLAISVSNASVQRVTGATELTLGIRYNVPTIMSMIGLKDIPMSFSRPIFLVQ